MYPKELRMQFRTVQTLTKKWKMGSSVETKPQSQKCLPQLLEKLLWMQRKAHNSFTCDLEL